MRLVLAIVLLAYGAVSFAQQKPQRAVRCTATPVCAQKSASCKSVQRTYTGASVGKAKDSIVQACVKANHSDRCNCIQQCRDAAQCVPAP